MYRVKYFIHSTRGKLLITIFLSALVAFTIGALLIVFLYNPITPSNRNDYGKDPHYTLLPGDDRKEIFYICGINQRDKFLNKMKENENTKRIRYSNTYSINPKIFNVKGKWLVDEPKFGC